MRGRDVRRALGALARRPELVPESLRMAASMRGRGRPLPSSDYLGWRLATAYGNTDASLPETDLVHYLEWRRQMRRIRSWKPK